MKLDVRNPFGKVPRPFDFTPFKLRFLPGTPQVRPGPSPSTRLAKSRLKVTVPGCACGPREGILVGPGTGRWVT